MRDTSRPSRRGSGAELPRSRRGAALLVLGSVACGGGSGDPPDLDTIVVDASQMHAFEVVESIASIRDLALPDDGTVWALNSIEPLFVGFSAEGDLVEARGQVGGGPDEYTAVAGLVAGGLRGEAWAYDAGRHGLGLASGSREARGDISFPVESIPLGSVLPGMSLFGSSVRTARLGDEVILPRRVGSGELPAVSVWTTIFNAELVALNPETGSVQTVVSLPETLGDVSESFERSGRDFPPFPFWMRLWAVCGDELRLYDFVRDELRGFTAGGVEIEPISVPVPFTRVTPRQLALVLFDLAAIELAGAVTPGVADMTARDSARIIDGFVSRLDGGPDELAAVLPKYVDFRCGDDGTMWLRTLDFERGSLNGGPVWVRVTADGRARQVRFPDGFDPLRFSGGRVWGALRDELDVATVAWTETPVGN